MRLFRLKHIIDNIMTKNQIARWNAGTSTQQASSGVAQEKAAVLLALANAGFEIVSAVQSCAAATGNAELAGRAN